MRIKHTKPLRGHKLTIEWSGEYGIESTSTGTCKCGWTESGSSREIVRDEAEAYLRDRRTSMLEDFTSRFGRPFSATLFIKENGRHGFEFAPRKAGAKKASRKKGTSKKSTRKKTTRKKTTRKKTTRKKASTKKAAAKKTTAKK